MAARTRVFGIVALLVAAYAFAVAKPWEATAPDGDRARPAATSTGRKVEVALTGRWESARQFQVSWTVEGVKHGPQTVTVSPWRLEVRAAAGSVVTVSLVPLVGGPGEHHCQIEEPPGRPLLGYEHRQGGGTTPLFCSHTVGT